MLQNRTNLFVANRIKAYTRTILEGELILLEGSAVRVANLLSIVENAAPYGVFKRGGLDNVLVAEKRAVWTTGTDQPW